MIFWVILTEQSISISMKASVITAGCGNALKFYSDQSWNNIAPVSSAQRINCNNRPNTFSTKQVKNTLLIGTSTNYYKLYEA